jgi:hypothetical protein
VNLPRPFGLAGVGGDATAPRREMIQNYLGWKVTLERVA